MSSGRDVLAISTQVPKTSEELLKIIVGSINEARACAKILVTQVSEMLPALRHSGGLLNFSIGRETHCAAMAQSWHGHWSKHDVQSTML